MSNSFAKLLRECRNKAKLSQKDLAEKISVDGSVISRLENGKAPPTADRLQNIIDILALHDVPQEMLEKLWESAGFHLGRSFDGPLADPLLSFLQQVLINLKEKQTKTLTTGLGTVIGIYQVLFKAEEEMKRQKWGDAAEKLAKGIEQLEGFEQELRATMVENLGSCHYRLGNYKSANSYFELALWNARQKQEKIKEANLLIDMGNSYRRGGSQNWEIARDRYNEARLLLKQHSNDVRVADCLRRLATVDLYQGRPDKAYPLCQESLELCRKAGHAGVVFYKGLQHLGWACDLLGRWQEATHHFEEANDIVHQITDDQMERFKNLRYLGDAYRLERRIVGTFGLERRLDEAEDKYLEALKIADSIDTKEVGVEIERGIIRLGLARVYLQRPGGELEAQMHLNKSMSIHHSIGEDFRLAEVWAEQGTLMVRLKRYRDAEMRLEQAKTRFSEWKNTFRYAITMSTMCELYYETGNGDFTRLFQAEADVLKEDNGLINYPLAAIEFTVGRAYLDEGHLDRSFAAFNGAAQYALNFNKEAFVETGIRIMDYSSRVARNIGPDIAIQLCESQLDFWQNNSDRLSPEQDAVVQEWLNVLRHKQDELKLYQPVP